MDHVMREDNGVADRATNWARIGRKSVNNIKAIPWFLLRPRGVKVSMQEVYWGTDSVVLTVSLGTYAVIERKNEIVEHIIAGWYTGGRSSLQAELEALKRGMQMAESLEIQKACIFSDSLEAIWTIYRGHHKDGMTQNTIESCFQFMERHKEWSLVYTPGEDIEDCHRLTKFAKTYKWAWRMMDALPRH
ncbi:hypothetical protein QQ045_029566 [Rhodiola kirilowii]